MISRYSSFRVIFFIFFAFILWGCPSIQKVQLDQEAFYKKTRSGIEQVDFVKPKASTLFVGAARVEITPPKGTPLAGYGKRESRGSEGTHDPLFARALALRQGEKRLILIANDLLAITDEMKEAVLGKINENTPLSSDGLMLSATHTHSGAGALGKKFLEQFAAGPFDPEIFKEITQKMTRAAIMADADMKPARIGHGAALAPDLIQNRMDRSGPIDPEVPFVLFQGSDGDPIAYLMNFSAHATVIKPDNFYYSGDYPGFCETALEEAGGVALFTAGAVADQTAKPPPGSNDFERAEAMGRKLARRVLEASRQIPFEEMSYISSATVPLYLPPAQVRIGTKRRIPQFLSWPFFGPKTALQIIQIDRIILIGIPGDLSVELGNKIKGYAQKKGFQAIIIGFANDYIGYILPYYLYETSSYEASMSFNGPQMGEYLLEMVQLLIDRAKVDGP